MFYLEKWEIKKFILEQLDKCFFILIKLKTIAVIFIE